MSQGYENAPITQVISFFTLVLSFFLGGNSSKNISFNLESLVQGQLYRIITSQLMFSSMAQTVLGLILLYTVRQFERQLGIKKFGALVCISFLGSVLIQIALIVSADTMGIENIIPSPGPYYLIYSLLPFFYIHIPKIFSSQYSIFGLSFSEKSWTYLIAVQLACCDGLSSMIPSLAGLIVGYIYVKDTRAMGIQSWRLPKRIEIIGGAIGGFFATLVPSGMPNPANTARPGATATATAVRGATTNNRGGNWMQEFNRENDHGLQQYGGVGPAPSENDIAALTSLGFERTAVVRALQETGNVEQAANMLLR